MDKNYIRLLERLKNSFELHEDKLEQIIELYCGLDDRTKAKYLGWLASRNYISKTDNGTVRVHREDIRRFLQAVEDINHDDRANELRSLHINSPKTGRKTGKGLSSDRRKRPANVRRRNRSVPILDNKLRYTTTGRVRGDGACEESRLNDNNEWP